MKYHNPNVKFSFEAVDNEESEVSFKLSEKLIIFDFACCDTDLLASR